MKATVHFSIDVPDLDRGVGFYQRVFGLEETARPFPAMAILRAGNATVCLHAKPAGSSPAPGSSDVRRYERHWTPVHLDFHVDDFELAVQRARAEGATIEQAFEQPRAVAFCCDPFGNGFCIIADR